MIESLSGAPVAYTLSGGVWIVMGVLVVAFLAIVFAYFTETGTEIGFHPWGDSRGDAPGALGRGNVGKDPTADVRTWTRGTSTSRGRSLPAPRTADLSTADERAMLSQLAAWRQNIHADDRGLTAPPEPARDHTLGPSDAPLQLVCYADFESASSQAAMPVVVRIRKRLADELLFVVRHFPLIDAHPMAMMAAEAVEAAGTQGRFFDMYRRIYRSRHPPTAESLRRHAARLGLDIPRFEHELAEHTHAHHIREDFETGLHSAVNGTPTFFVNGLRHDDENTLDSLLSALETAR